MLRPPGVISRLRLSLGVAKPVLMPASRLAGSELIALGGSESIELPEIDHLPVSSEDRDAGLAGTHLVLPPPSVRILRDVRVRLESGHLSCGHGVLVSESVPVAERNRRRERRKRREPTPVSGNVTAFAAPHHDPCSRLAESMPKLILLQHPAVRRFGPITVVHSGLSAMEKHILGFRDPKHLVLREFEPETVVSGDRTVLAGPVTRSGTAGLPSWYREWLKRHLSQSSPPGASLMLALVHGPRDPLAASPILDTLRGRGFTVVDTEALTFGNEASHDSAAGIASAIRDASVLVGASDSALAHVAFANSARVVQVGLSPTVTARAMQLAVSCRLSFHFTGSAHIEATLDMLRNT